MTMVFRDTEEDGSTWLRQGPYFWDGPGGTRVCACKTPNGWLFSAWGALELPKGSYWDWANERATAGVYVVGQGIPQMREWLGVFEEAEKARLACLAWLRDSTPA